MSLLADHGDENRNERQRSVPPPAVYPQLVLGLSGHGNVNANGHGNGNLKENPNYRYSIELASPAKLSPISASGVFSRYNVFSPLNNSNSNSKNSKSTSKHGGSLPQIVGDNDGGDSSSNDHNKGNDSYSMPPTASAASSNKVEEISNGHDDEEGSAAPLKKFKNPFASSVVSSFGTLELSGVTEGSFTTISISTIDTAEENVGKCSTNTKTTVRANDAQDERIDRILRIAKKMMGDELIEDLIASSTPTVRAQTHRQRRFGFPAVDTCSSDGNDKNIESVGEFVETVIEKELTFCSWTCELTIRQDFAGLDGVSLDGISLDGGLHGFSLGSFGTGFSTGTVVRYLHRHDPCQHHDRQHHDRQHHDRQHQLSLVDVLKPRKRDWFLRLLHWHHPHHRVQQV